MHRVDLKLPNPALWWIVSSAIAILMDVLFVPVLNDLFSFSNLHLVDLALCGLMGISIFGLLEISKMLRDSKL